MKRLFTILICALPVLFCRCSEEKDILPEQRQKVVSYLERSHIPTLVPETSVEEGSQLPFYSTSGSTVYRYIGNFYRSDRNDRPEVTADAKVTISFRAYVFNYTNIPDDALPFYANDTTWRKSYKYLLPEDWTFEPLTVDMRGGILNGLREALLGCREKDEVEAYMTYNMAFGDKYFSTIPRESPVAWFFTVGDIEY